MITAQGNPTICVNLYTAITEPDYKEEFFSNSLKINVFINLHPEKFFFDFDPIVVYVMVHNRMQLLNPFFEGHALAGGEHYTGIVSMSENIRLPAPYDTNCKDYIKSWKENQGFGPLTQQECIEHCKLTTVTSLNMCADEQIIYSHTEELCLRDITATDDIIKNCTEKCQPACM
ncbi:uncharacterized protein [Parasteatoda tepidariorum]|uniref:uncharacterized protein n=1 Tax=Parasteatoda tepidariorum TaxID=114398 RepID=UPI0039BCE324